MLSQIKQYRILDEIGGGGFAKVYRALDETLHRDVAIKVLHAHYAEHDDFRRFFEREARMVASLEHLAVVPIYDYGEIGGQLYLVMRYMRGGSLADRLFTAKRALPLDEAIVLVERLAPTLDAIHDRNIIHRDLKPSNILYDEGGNAYIADFGIARMQEATSRLTQSGMSLGTPQYSSPEQITGEQIVDRRSDLYSLGVILFEMLTGELPYRSDSPLGWVHKHAEAPIPDASEFNRNLPEGVSAVIGRLLAKSPQGRYESVGAVLEALKRAAQGLPVAVHAPRGSDAETRILAPENPRPVSPVRDVPPRNVPASAPKRSAFWTGILTLALMAAAAFIMIVLGSLGLTLLRNRDGGTPETGSAATATSQPATEVAAVPATQTPPLSSSSPAPPTPTTEAPSATAVQPTATTEAPSATAVPPTQTAPVATSVPTPNADATAQAAEALNQLPRVVRSRETLIVPYRADAPAPDGDLSEWAPDSFVKVQHLLYQPQNVSDERDHSAFCAVTWNEAALSMACRVRDDALVQESSGNRLYEGDSLELHFDTQVMRDTDSAEMDRDDYQIGILPGAVFDRASEVYLWFPRVEERFLSEVAVGSRRTTEGYDVELNMPWEVLDAQPKSSDFFGFGLNINDNDTAGTAAQESQLSLISTQQWATPPSWGLLLLTGGR